MPENEPITPRINSWGLDRFEGSALLCGYAPRGAWIDSRAPPSYVGMLRGGMPREGLDLSNRGLSSPRTRREGPSIPRSPGGGSTNGGDVAAIVEPPPGLSYSEIPPPRPGLKSPGLSKLCPSRGTKAHPHRGAYPNRRDMPLACGRIHIGERSSRIYPSPTNLFVG